MAGRPPKDDSRDKQYRVRLNDDEESMLTFCSEQTGEVKSEIFRKALKAYYENAKYFKNVLKAKDEQTEQEDDYTEYDEYDYGMDGISLKRAIECPYCGAENNMDFADECETSCEERQMGPQVEYMFDLEDCICENCEKRFRVQGRIWEYPMGAYNYEDITIEPLEEEDDEE
jgi:hypothetical protein